MSHVQFGKKEVAPEFTGLRKFFWPIHNHELKKFLPMVLMMFCFLYNYTIMRDMKDTLIVTAAGAEAIPFLKFWGTLPTSILFVVVYAKLSNVLKPTTLFYSMVMPFLIFFAAFGFIIYPNIELISPTQAADVMQNYVISSLPERMHDTLIKLISVIRVWPYALFYVLSELWGSMGISLLFWQFANHITRSGEAKRFYAGFGQLGNLALVFSGLTIIHFSDIRSTVGENVDAWKQTLEWLTGAITVCCVIIMATYWWMNKNVLTDPTLFQQEDKVAKKSKPKLSLKESFLFLIRSKYLGLIAMIILGYGISINLIEVIWKAQLKLQFTNENDYMTFMGYFSMCTGFATLFLVTLGSNVIRRLGWLVGALSAPLMILVTGGLFFAFIMYKDDLGGILPYTPLWLAVMFGAAQNILSKATKYSLFDPTKEMAYIPLDPESKVKGKAAVDVIGGRLGKSGGGVILQVVLAFGAIADNLFVLFICVALVIGAWITSVFALGKMYHIKLREKGEEEEVFGQEAAGTPATPSASTKPAGVPG